MSIGPLSVTSLLSMSPQCYTGSLQRSAHIFKSSKKKAFFQYLHIVLKCSLIETNWVTSPSSSNLCGWERTMVTIPPLKPSFTYTEWTENMLEVVPTQRKPDMLLSEEERMRYVQAKTVVSITENDSHHYRHFTDK